MQRGPETDRAGPHLHMTSTADKPSSAAPGEPDDDQSAPDAEQAREELDQLDDELARSAEQTIRAAIDEEDFDLEGEFLSQDEVNAILAREAELDPADEHALDADAGAGDFEPVVASAEQLPSAEESQPEALEAAALDESADASEPQAPAPLEVAAQSESPAEGNRTPVAEDDAEDAPDEQVLQPAARADVDQDDPLNDDDFLNSAFDDEALAATASVDQVDAEAESLLEEASAPQRLSGLWRRFGPAGVYRGLVAAATAADIPFRRVPSRAKNLIGLLGGMTLLAGIIVWVLTIFR